LGSTPQATHPGRESLLGIAYFLGIWRFSSAEATYRQNKRGHGCETIFHICFLLDLYVAKASGARDQPHSHTPTRQCTSSTTYQVALYIGRMEIKRASSTTGGSPTSATVRHAKATDLATIGRLGALLVKEHHDFDSRRFLAPTDRTLAGYAAFLGTQLEDPQAAVLVADDHGKVIGYTYATLEDYDYMMLRGPAGILQDIIVEPEQRGRGVGRLLLEATLAHLEARGAPRVILSTAEQNEPAQRLFASVGFRRTMIEMTRELDLREV
jgi:ribosomal protein S18 acetylase RimI-like enzyme